MPAVARSRMTAESLLDLYLDEIARVRAIGAGTAETSYYPAVGRVLNEAGRTLKPRVFCLHHPSGESGIPDFGLFEQPQFRRGETPQWNGSAVPERGVVEVKGASHSMAALLESKQVREKYLPAYRLLLATNLWQFRLVGGDGAAGESFDLAAEQAGFWALVHGSRTDALRTRFADFLQRCLLARAPLGKPSDVAFFLASYARDALARLSERADLPALKQFRDGMESALGIAFKGKSGEHMFRSTLVQTLFYGLFSGWVAHVRDPRRPHRDPGRFDWRSAQWSLHIPVMRFLFQQVATPEALEPLQLVPLLDAAGETLNRVDVRTFFAAFEDAQAVQYFYEPFLRFFDPALRRELGVWYTPPEIVAYMVERVDRVLRSELGVADGLADPNVWVLDPCCGTGSFVVAVIERIRRTLQGRGHGDLVGEMLKQAATTRVVGFEIMTAPLVIAHWQVGEVLRRAGAPLGDNERAAVFLTNALTGWESGEVRGEMPGFDVLVRERTAAAVVKQDEPILVVIGNPPYNAYAGVSPAAERGLVKPYKESLRERWGVRKYNLDDLFVRFFRIGERRIAERTGRGIVCYISNYSWLSLPSFTLMRQSLLRSFDRMWIENMHGDRTITECGPDGRSSETVFASVGFSLGIRKGVATALLARTGQQKSPKYLFRDDIDASKATRRRADLVATLDDPEFESRYIAMTPCETNRFSLRPGISTPEYLTWTGTNEISITADWSGLLEMRRGALISDDRMSLEGRMAEYCNGMITIADLRLRGIGPVFDAARFDSAKARRAILLAGGLSAGRFERIALYPFDRRWCFHSNVRPLWNEPRPEVAAETFAGNTFFVTRAHARRPGEGFPSFSTSALPGYHLLDPNSHPMPFALHGSADQLDIGLAVRTEARANLSPQAVAYCERVGVTPNADTSRLMWHHALAITYSPAYLAENADGIRQGFPRIPLPADAALLRASAALGAQLAALLDPDTPIPGVSEGEPRPALRAIAVPTTRPDQARDWRLSAGWGSRTNKGITMPGRGRIETRAYTPDEAATEAEAAILGARTHDVFLNGATYWRNIPDAVWECRIGGYQVLKKWLSYRDHAIIDRALTAEEVAHIQHTARRLAAILLLGPALDASYRACAAAHRPLPPPAR